MVEKIVKKISKWAIALVFVLAIAGAIVPEEYQVITSTLLTFTLVCMYFSYIIDIKHEKGYYHKGLILMLIGYASWIVLNSLYSPFGHYGMLISLIFVYTYLLTVYYIKDGKINKTILIMGVVFTTVSFSNLYFSNKLVRIAGVLVQFYVMSRILNPIFLMFAKLGMQATPTVDYHVPLWRKIIFGKTGKVRTDIIKMIIEESKNSKKIEK